MRTPKEVKRNFRFDYIVEYAKANDFKEYMSDLLDKKLEDCTILEDDFRITWHGKELCVPVHPETYNAFYCLMNELMEFWNEMIEEEIDFAKDAMTKSIKSVNIKLCQ